MAIPLLKQCFFKTSLRNTLNSIVIMEIAWLMPNSQPEHLLEEQGMASFLVSNANS